MCVLVCGHRREIGGNVDYLGKQSCRGLLTWHSLARVMLSGDDHSSSFSFCSSWSPHLPCGEPPSPGWLPATYWTNPQFKIHLDEVDDRQEESVSEPCCTVLLGLMQKNRRRQKRMGQGMLSIGYAVYKVLRSGGQPSWHAWHLWSEYFGQRLKCIFLFVCLFLIKCSPCSPKMLLSMALLRPKSHN